MIQEDKSRFNFDEPWKKLSDDGSVILPGDGYRVDHRTLIKNRTDCPHLAVIMPVGNKSDQIVGVDGNGEKQIIRAYRQPGLVPIELMLNQMQVLQPLNVSLSWYILKNDISSILRERMTNQALADGVNFIFYWDDDVLIPVRTWYAMLNHMAHYPDLGLVTGVVWTRAKPTEPLVYKDGGCGAYWGFSLDPNAPPEEIQSGGAGCMMVRADCIRKMEPPYWMDERSGDSEGYIQGIVGHDIRFYNKVRQTGYRTCVDGSLQCQHFDIEKQKVFQMPADMPSMEDARDAADRHVGLDRHAEVKDGKRTIKEIEAALT